MVIANDLSPHLKRRILKEHLQPRKANHLSFFVYSERKIPVGGEKKGNKKKD